jgi:uncharacterized membrane protein YsdA (DUF1294 family)
MSSVRGRTSPRTYHAAVALVLTLAMSGMLLFLFRPVSGWPPYLAAWLVSINIVAFGYYGYDKARARGAASRVPEVVLHGLTFLGGSIGAYAGMELFRHKTIKGSFRIVFWFIAVLQLTLIAVVIYRIIKG